MSEELHRGEAKATIFKMVGADIALRYEREGEGNTIIVVERDTTTSLTKMLLAGGFHHLMKIGAQRSCEMRWLIMTMTR